ncbi:ABC transporter transmembrane domain-containing protein [Labrys neptuniae]
MPNQSDPDKSGLFSFVWRHSRRHQLLLLAATVASFPVLYFSLELPKYILNGAIQGHATPLDRLGLHTDHTTLLLWLCFIFLGCTLANGVIKMQLSIYRGVIGERLIRRLRYKLIAQVLRFPLQRFDTVSQGEVVSMVTAESEPLTGVMGDAFAQPVFQAGQILTIVSFLFLQNVWLGIAGIGLIPVQAYLIPRMQRHVSRLNHQRVGRVRALSERIGESVAGVADLRHHGGTRYRLAEFSALLGELYTLRLRIFERKFLIKFVNNAITQLTPFLFFLIGGYLVIGGQLSVGALIAALSASRDIADPWRELLTYWNQAQEAASRYHGLLDEFEAPETPAPVVADSEVPRLNGPVHLRDVTVSGLGGVPLLDQVDLSVPGGAFMAIQSADMQVRRALCDILSGAARPSAGQVTISDLDLADASQTALAARIGVASSTPYLFRGTIAENTRMPLHLAPEQTGEPQGEAAKALAEAIETANSPDRLDVVWGDGGLIGFADQAEANAWWLKILDAIGRADVLLDRALDGYLVAGWHDALAGRVLALREDAAQRLEVQGLFADIHRFEPGAINPGLTIGENLLYAVRHHGEGETNHLDDRLLAGIAALSVVEPLLSFSIDLAATLVRAFGEVGPRHPLLRRFTTIGPELFERLRSVAARELTHDIANMSAAEHATLLSLLFNIAPSDLGTDLPAGLAAAILAARASHGAILREQAGASFAPIEAEAYHHELTVLENLVFGLLAAPSEIKRRQIHRTLMDVVEEHGLAGELRLLVGEVRTSIAGANLAPAVRERIALARAVIRRPDLVVLDHAMASASDQDRQVIWRRLRALLPQSTIILLEPQISQPEAFDLTVTIRDGRLINGAGGRPPRPAYHASISQDLQNKVEVLSTVETFHGLKRSQIELLAYASRWTSNKEGEHVFRTGEMPDGAYVCASGSAELRWVNGAGEEELVSTILPGRLIGDLAVILGQTRMVSMVATADITCLRIGTREFLDIVESDITVALLLLRAVGQHLVDVGVDLRAAGMSPNTVRSAGADKAENSVPTDPS